MYLRVAAARTMTAHPPARSKPSKLYAVPASAGGHASARFAAAFRPPCVRRLPARRSCRAPGRGRRPEKVPIQSGFCVICRLRRYSSARRRACLPHAPPSRRNAYSAPSRSWQQRYHAHFSSPPILLSVRVVAAEVFPHLAAESPPPGAHPAGCQRNCPQDTQNPAHRYSLLLRNSGVNRPAYRPAYRYDSAGSRRTLRQARLAAAPRPHRVLRLQAQRSGGVPGARLKLPVTWARRDHASPGRRWWHDSRIGSLGQRRHPPIPRNRPGKPGTRRESALTDTQTYFVCQSYPPESFSPRPFTLSP